MPAKQRRVTRWLLAGAAVLAASAFLGVAGHGAPTATAADDGDIWLPLALGGFEGPFPDLPRPEPTDAPTEPSAT
ncbi:MAG: hypothetical protein ACK2T6_09270, partial [Anaerolineae bacterium]